MVSDKSNIDHRTTGRALIAGGSVLAGATLTAGVGNYALNVILGRWLGPSEFSDANLMVTLMLLATAIAISLQLLAAKFVSRHQAAGTEGEADKLTRWLENRALMVGAALGLGLSLTATRSAEFFNTESAWPIAVLGWGMPFYLAHGVGRGVLQGRLQFKRLASTYIVEMVVRLGVSVSLVALGFGVVGATIGLTVSFIATWISVRLAIGRRSVGKASTAELRRVVTEIGPVAILLAGQIVINNQDVLWVKRQFEPELAGAYAGIALIGRAVFFLSWSVVAAVFPASSQRSEVGADARRILFFATGAVSLIGVLSVVGAILAGDIVLSEVFGPGYVVVGGYLPWYAAATSLFAVANLLASYELSIGRRLGPRLILGGAFVQSLLLVFMGDEIKGVIQAQVIAMFTLTAVCAYLILRPQRVEHTVAPNHHQLQDSKKVAA